MGRRTEGHQALTQPIATLVYRYASADRGSRVVVARWFAEFSPQDPKADVEVTAGGRVQDRDGLQAVVDRASKEYLRAG